MDNDDKKLRFDNQIGEEYDLFKLSSPYHDEIQNTVALTLKININKTKAPVVVEIGFGTGITSKAVLEINSDIKLIAVDNVADMLPKATKTLGLFDSKRFDLYTDDALSFLKKIKDETVDAIVSVWVLHNLEKSHRFEVVKEVYRILKTNGVFINGDKIAEDDTEKHQSNLKWQLDQFDIYEKMGRPELKKEWMEHYYEDEDTEKIIYNQEFKDAIMSLGFKSYELIDRKYMDAVVLIKK